MHRRSGGDRRRSRPRRSRTSSAGPAKAIRLRHRLRQRRAGIRATAWANFDVDLSLGAGRAAREAFLNRYPGMREYQRRQADIAEATGGAQRAWPPLKADGRTVASGIRRP